MRSSVLLLLFFMTPCYAQNITNTLPASGTFYITDGSTVFLSISQTDGRILLPDNSATQNGIICKGGYRFIHNYSIPGTNGANTFLGLMAGSLSITWGASEHASNNTGVGSYVLSNLTTGYCNSGFGSQALSHNTTGVGNSAFGHGALSTNTAGAENTGVGYYALYANTGSYNSAFGSNALWSNQTGIDNCAVGYSALFLNTTGSCNSALGYQSLNHATASHNTAIGHIAGSDITSGENNTAVGSNSAYGLTTGSNNTMIGYRSGNGIVSGSNNICIGYYSNVPSASGNNQVSIGNSSISYAGIQVAWTITSDRRWKKDIRSSDLGLEFISNLHPVSYIRTNGNEKTEYGFIAQEIDEVLKKYQVMNPGMITVDDRGYYNLRYNDLLAPLVKAIQELKTRNENLETRLQKLEQFIADQRRTDMQVSLTGKENK